MLKDTRRSRVAPFEFDVICESDSRMVLDAIHVHFEANDVLATSFAAMHVGKVSRRSMRCMLGAGARLI